MVTKELLDNLPVRSQREPKRHIVQRLDELRCSTAKFRQGLEEYRGLGLSSGLAFGLRFEGGLILNGDFWGDFVLVPCGGLFAFWDGGLHDAGPKWSLLVGWCDDLLMMCVGEGQGC